ncbi:hypothetical protein SAMN05421644_13732 [Allochromatium warmingii]|uniref:Transposase DDE domain-containing protein n=1 Tax=Allochromatium warmingii TaxID=61595 RepID=A0A1H3HXI9_ALLWA|nr:hypothetical protein SAMN05421644_13732 [Allochromatium warmingii]
MVFFAEKCGDATDSRTIRIDCPTAAAPAGQRAAGQFRGGQRHPVRRGQRLQVARTAQPLWAVAQHLHAHEPLGQGRCAGCRVRAPAAAASDAGSPRSGEPGLDDHEGASEWYGCAEKNGLQAIVKSQGGWSTKLHLVAASACDVVTWSLTSGQAADGSEGHRLIEAMGRPREAGDVALLMDSAYEGDATRELAQQLGFVNEKRPRR